MTDSKKQKESCASKKTSTQRLVQLMDKLSAEDAEDVTVIAKKMLRKKSRVVK